MVGKWKENGSWKTIRAVILTAIITALVSWGSGQLFGMFSWKGSVDKEIAVLQEKVIDSCKKVDSFEARVMQMDDKLTKIYEILATQNGKKK